MERHKFSWEGRANGSWTKEADWGAARAGALPPLGDAAGLTRLPLNLRLPDSLCFDSDDELCACKSNEQK